MNAVHEFTEMKQHAEAIRNDDEHRIETMSPGDAWAQGDVGIICLEKLPVGSTKVAKPSAQLAPGTTQGSRHCLRSLRGVTIYQPEQPTPLDGPIVDAPQGCAIDHPEHGNVILPPGVYAIVYQRAYSDELRRVQD